MKRSREPIRTVALMIVTKDRLPALARALHAIRQMDVPAGITLRIVVADNATPPNTTEINAAAAAEGLTIEYAHEPVRGYASIRNCAVKTAPSGPADLLIAVDDDVLASRSLLANYLDVFDSHTIDAVAGLTRTSKQRSREGERMKKASTENIAFRRWIVDPDGLGLVFDPRLNRIGFEDFSFFESATAAGAILIASHKPTISHQEIEVASSDPAVSPNDAQRVAVAMARMQGRNEIVAARCLGGWGRASRVFITKYPVAMRRWLSAEIQCAVDAALKPGRIELTKANRSRCRARLQGAIEGFYADGLDRPAARRGELLDAGVFTTEFAPPPQRTINES